MFQIVQENKNEVRVRIVPNAEWTPEMFEMTEKKLSDRLGSMKIYIETCPEIPRSSTTGKIRCIYNATI